MVLPQDVCSSVFEQFVKGGNGEATSGSLSQKLMALMPENAFSNHPVSMQLTVSHGHQSSVLNFLNLTMFLVSNNFFGATADVSKKVYNWVKCHSNAGLLDYLLSISGPTAEALAENLFPLAIDADDVCTVKKLMESGIDPNEQMYCTSYGLFRTPLQRACEMRSLELVRLLIEAGADVNDPRSEGYSTLVFAVDNFYRNSEEDFVVPELVRFLLWAGAMVNPRYGGSPLALAAESGHVETVAILISAGADVNFSDEETGATPLIEAVESHDNIPDEDVNAIVRNLLQAGADVQAIAVYEDRRTTVLEAAIWGGNVELIQLLLEGGARIHESAFIAAIKCCNLDIVKLLLKSGVRVTQEVIESATAYGEFALVLLLLDSAEDCIKERSCSAALTAAIHYGKMDLFEVLVASEYQLQSTSKLTDAISAAAQRGDTCVFRFLLGENSRYRASVIVSSGGALTVAIAKGRSDITEMLLAAGVDVSGVNCQEIGSPLLEAIRRKDAHLARKLLAAGAAVNARYPSSVSRLLCTTTVLPAAVAWGYLPLIREIISAGAEVSAPEYEGGKTALTVAVEREMQ